ncbi:hypothetical protein [Flavobacterium sp. N3904]|uniref:hypothetical protein n=1 Tax=Flavobacterium sp. N3904 TaxID=2986835 RepID=UPI002225B06E|nr:hypothetical protein [Flavobacterium sp. N3904]
MIESNFIKVFGISVFHTYFENNKCNCLHFTPNGQTEKILRKFGFIINTTANGFDLFYNATSSIDSVLDYISKTTKQDFFDFSIKSSNPNFMLFTALPINWLGQIIYNSQDAKNLNNDGTIQLHQTLETKETTLLFGQLKIYFEDIKKYQTGSKPIHFEINFKARETQWQYYIINRSAIPLNNPTIAEKNTIQFDGPEKVTIQTGEQALLFTSNETYIQLSEKPKYKFDLIEKNTSDETKQKNTNAKIIIKGLPVPDVSRIAIIENNQVASPMYIYL